MSTPQIIIQDFGGKLASDMDATRARLIQGGSWKQQRTILIQPAAFKLGAKPHFAQWNLLFPPNNAVVKMLALGCEVGEAYSSAIEAILQHPELSQWEYVLTIEHDNCPPQDAFLKILENMEAHPELAAIGGLYFTKGEGGVAQIWGDPRDAAINFRPQPPIPEALQECCGTGMGFTVYRLSMFKDKRLARPLFKTAKGPGGIGTQDLAFWAGARPLGYRCAIDTRVKVGHWDESTDIVW